MTIFLHIGMPKTGSTTIQNFLRANRQVLALSGHLYPESPLEPAHEMLSIFAGHPKRTRSLRISTHTIGHDAPSLADTRARFQEAFYEECSNAKKVILSSEHCYSRLLSDEEVLRLRDLLYGVTEDVKVICYLRRQDQHLASHYSTAVKVGSTRPIDVQSERPRVYQYHTILDRWARAFGDRNIVVRSYDRDRLVGGDIVTDFMEVVGIPHSRTLVQVPSQNESLDPTLIEFLRLFNRHVPRFVGEQLNPIRHGLVAQLANSSHEQKLELDPKVAERYVAKYEQENRLVAQRFVDPPTDSLFSSKFSAPTGPQAELTVERAVEIAADLFNWRSAALLKQPADLDRGGSKPEWAKLDLTQTRTALRESEADRRELIRRYRSLEQEHRRLRDRRSVRASLRLASVTRPLFQWLRRSSR